MPILELLEEDFIGKGSTFGNDVRIVDLSKPRKEFITDWIKSSTVSSPIVNYSLISGSIENTDKYCLGGMVDGEPVVIGKFIKTPNNIVPECREGWLTSFLINPKYKGHEWTSWFSIVMMHLFIRLMDTFLFSYFVLDPEGYYDKNVMKDCVVSRRDDDGFKKVKEKLKLKQDNFRPITNVNIEGVDVKVLELKDVFLTTTNVYDGKRKDHVNKIKILKEKKDEKIRLSNQQGEHRPN